MSRLSKLGFIDTRRTQAAVRARVRSRGVPVALRDREVFCTDDQLAAADLVERFLGRNTLHVADTGAVPFQATLNAIRVRDVTMAHLDFHTATTVDIPATGKWYAVHMPTNGQAVCSYRSDNLTITPYSALVTSPGEAVRMTFEFDSPQVIIRIEARAVERTLTRMLGRTPDHPVAFEPTLDLTTDRAVRWHAVMQLLSTEILTPGSLIQGGAGAGQLEEFVVSTLLLIQGSNHHASLLAPTHRTGRRAVHRSLGFIEANLARPITLSDLASATHMSPRSIQQGFRDDLGTTPMAYVRDQRLDRVRARLVDALPEDGVTVTEVAEQWGFAHLGNFAAMYRRRFGETPSQTLHR